MISVDCEASDEWDRSIDWAALAERSVAAAIGASRWPQLAERDVEVSIRLADDEDVRALNAQWRGKDRPTNVLSFPIQEPSDLDHLAMGLLGDVVLAAGVCRAEADAAGIVLEEHAAHLIVHGLLHLLGYDHEPSDEAAEEMEDVERRALASIGIADPYRLTEVQSH